MSKKFCRESEKSQMNVKHVVISTSNTKYSGILTTDFHEAQGRTFELEGRSFKMFLTNQQNNTLTENSVDDL